MKRLLLTVVLLLSGLLDTVSAAPRLVILKGEAAGAGQARLIVSVVDEAGRPIKGLSRDDFQLGVGDETMSDLTVEPVSATESPLSIVMGVDISGSMRGSPFAETQRAVSIFLDQLDRKDLVCVMSFGTQVRFLTDFIAERHLIREAVEGLKAADMETHLYDATYEGLGKARDEARTTRSAVVIITDGKDTRSARSRQEALDRARGSSVPLFMLGFGREIDSAYLEEVAETAGGRFLSTPDPGQVVALYEQVLEHLKNQYSVVFPLNKDAGLYTASLDVKQRDGTARARKEFVFSPPDAPLIQQPGDNRLPWVATITAFALVGGLIATTLLVVEKRGQREVERLQKELAARLQENLRCSDCQLEFPEGMKMNRGFLKSYLNSFSSPVDQDRQTVGVADVPQMYLKVDALSTRVIPLSYASGEMLEELIVARRGGHPASVKKGVAYLWVAEKIDVVSRPKDGCPGHARIYLVPDKERYAIEHLAGDRSKTLLNREDIKDVSHADRPLLLRPNDTLDVGGSRGIRIVYGEGRPEAGAGFSEIGQTITRD